MAGRHWKSNRLYYFIAAYTLVLGFLASLGYVEIGKLHEEQEKKARESVHEEVVATASNKALYRLPRMELTLPSFESGPHHARIDISLEMDKGNIERFNDFQPRVSDRIIDFLRQQNVDEIRRPSFTPVLRSDLLKQINMASSPIPVTDIIFREFVIR
jgi:flagellar basal body-associated protein FliL